MKFELKLKKYLFPFLDLSWLKLPLASLLLGGLVLLAGLVSGVSAWYHSGHVEALFGAVLGPLVLGYVALVLMMYAFFGYLVRVTTQVSAGRSNRLPAWDRVGRLLVDGILMGVAQIVWLQVAGMMVMIPAHLLLGCVGVLLGKVHSVTSSSFLLGSGIFGLSLIGLAEIIVLFLVLVVAGMLFPLAVTRYAHTRRLRHLFGFRWAWRAAAIAPWQYATCLLCWGLLITAVTVLTPLTAGFASILAWFLWPLGMLNHYYLVGEYYARYLND